MEFRRNVDGREGKATQKNKNTMYLEERVTVIGDVRVEEDEKLLSNCAELAGFWPKQDGQYRVSAKWAMR